MDDQEPQCGKWEPADTAPKTGEYFIANDPRCGLLFTMHWCEDAQKFLTEYERWSGAFTHWMPRPDYPEEQP